DWEAAARSVAKLESLQPEVVATGHGKPMRGREMRERLRQLVNHFREEAVPSRGRYVHQAAEADEHGVTFVPPRDFNVNRVALGLGLFALAAAGAYLLYARRRNESLLSRLPDIKEQAMDLLTKKASSYKSTAEDYLGDAQHVVGKKAKPYKREAMDYLSDAKHLVGEVAAFVRERVPTKAFR
ncbi:MAG TPA: hypothetical protein VEY71_11265, partial [Chitinophagales bacterium]|nr:hypothetical protein [Chitinophagales bacterium]